MGSVSTARRTTPAEPPRAARRKKIARNRARRVAPTPDAVLRAPGKPLDPAVRRDMEEQLGYDFARVRIHSDEDAAALTALIGADAVAVGPEIFFADKAFRPETAAGRRLLAHELLHTVQVPTPPAAMPKAALSRPLDVVEHEAESVVRRDSPTGEVTTAKAQPVAWLRFVTLNAAELRAEQLDPATLVDRIVAGVIRSLRGDPTDASRRVRQQLERMAPPLRSDVQDGLQKRLPTPEYGRVEELAADVDTSAGGSPDTPNVPAPVADLVEKHDTDAANTRERHRSDDEHTKAREEDKPQEHAQRAEDATDKAESDKNASRREADAKDLKLGDQKDRDAQEEASQTAEDDRKKQDEQARQDAEDKQNAEKEKSAAEQTRADAAGGAAKPAGLGAMFGGAGPPAAVGVTPAVGAAITPGPMAGDGAPPVSEDRADAVANDPTGPLARHGLKDDKQPQADKEQEAPEQEKPEGTESAADSEVAQPEPADPEPPAQTAEQADKDAGEDKAAPDPVPKADPDLSAVPTVDEELRLPATGEPPRPQEAPSLPGPPPVEAEPEQLEARARAEREAENEPELDRADQESAEDKKLDQRVEAAARAPEQQPAQASEPPAEQQDTAPAEPADGATAEQRHDETVAADGATSVAEGEPSRAQPMPGDPELVGPQADGAAAPGVPVPDGAAGFGHPGAGPEGSLEPGGGGCAGALITDSAAGGEGAGGGGCAGGAPPAPEEAKQEEAAPDVEQQQPQEALATAGALPPAKIPQALGGVSASVNRSVGEEHDELQADPPQLERPVGAPQTLKGPPESGPAVESNLQRLTEVTPETLAKQREASPPPTPVTGNPADRVRPPDVSGGTDDKASDAEIQRVQAAVDGVPTTDQRLYTTVGPAPRFRLAGQTDPGLADEQKKELDEQSAQLQDAGQRDAAVPLGENKIYPNVPLETLRGRVPARSGGTAGGTGGQGAGATAVANAGQAAGATVDAGSVSAVAVQERGPQIQAGLSGGQTQMSTATEQKTTDSSTQREDSQTHIDDEIQKDQDRQAAARAEAKAEVNGQRTEWRRQQDKLVADNTAQADTEHTKAVEGTYKQKTDTDAEAEKERDKNNADIQAERKKAEEDARKERQRKKEESSGWFGWIKSKVKAAFNALVNAVKAVFKAAIGLINKIKDAFKAAINKLIDLATKAIVGLIKGLANALIKISGVLLAAFPELRDKVRKSIEGVRDAAIKKVQQFADSLKKAINKLIDALAGALIAILEVYEKLLLAAIEFVRDVVDKALSFVEGLIKLLGMIAALIKDIAPDPIGWIKKLGTAAVDGIKNYLWGETKRAVKQWFDEKVESVIGVGKVLWNVLIKGCMTVAQIGKMAWEAVIKALPTMIISLIIEKLVSLIIPAAGAIMTIIQGLQAAYGAISKVIAAFSAFFTFLRAVKAGGAAAACLFAKALAAGAVALLDFIANFLLVRLGSALKGVGGRLKGIAQKIMAGLGRGAKAVKKAAGAAINVARNGLKRGAAAIKRGVLASARAIRRGASAGARAVKRGAKNIVSVAKTGARRAGAFVSRAAKTVRRTVGKAVSTVGRTAKRLGSKLAKTKVGKAIVNGAKKIRDGYRNARQKLRDWRKRLQERRRQRSENKKKKPQESKEQRLERVAKRIQPRVAKLLHRGVRGVVLRSILAGMRLWYRLSGLAIEGGHQFRIVARLNPNAKVGNGFVVDRDRLLQFVRDLGKEILEKATPQTGSIGEGVRPGSIDPKTKQPRAIPEYRIPPGTSLPAVLQRATEMKERGWGSKEILTFLHEHPAQLEEVTGTGRSALGVGGAKALEIARQQKTGGLRNKVVSLLEEGREVRTDLKYRDMARTIGRQGAAEGKVIGSELAKFAAGGRPGGPNSGMVAFLGTLMVVQEGHRNVGAVVTSGMTIQMLQEGRDFKDTLNRLPMAMAKAQKGADEVEKYLQRTPEERKKREPTRQAKKLINRELNAIKLWVQTLNIYVDDVSGMTVQQQLEAHIRQRMYQLYGLSQQSAAASDVA